MKELSCWCFSLKVLFVEPPKDFWFVMGEYLPPPLGILNLAAYLKVNNPDVEIEVLDCQAERLGWGDIEKQIEVSNPDVVAPSALATCNAFKGLRVAGNVARQLPFLHEFSRILSLRSLGREFCMG